MKSLLYIALGALCIFCLPNLAERADKTSLQKDSLNTMDAIACGREGKGKDKDNSDQTSG